MAEILTIPVILAVLNTEIITGLTIKNLGAASIQAGWCISSFVRRVSIMKKLSSLLFFCLYNDFPNTKQRKEFYKLICQIFKKYDKNELYVIYKFYKSLKPVMKLVVFNDIYFEKNKYKLIEHPELLKMYAIKKLYIQRINHLITVKMYNASPCEKSITALQDNLVKILMNENIDEIQVEDFTIAFEQSINKQYETKKSVYDKDFNDEKAILMKLVSDINEKEMDFMIKSSLTSINDLIKLQENKILDPKKLSTALSNSLNEVVKANNATKKPNNMLDKLRSN